MAGFSEKVHILVVCLMRVQLQPTSSSVPRTEAPAYLRMSPTTSRANDNTNTTSSDETCSHRISLTKPPPTISPPAVPPPIPPRRASPGALARVNARLVYKTKQQFTTKLVERIRVSSTITFANICRDCTSRSAEGSVAESARHLHTQKLIGHQAAAHASSAHTLTNVNNSTTSNNENETDLISFYSPTEGAGKPLTFTNPGALPQQQQQQQTNRLSVSQQNSLGVADHNVPGAGKS